VLGSRATSLSTTPSNRSRLMAPIACRTCGALGLPGTDDEQRPVHHLRQQRGIGNGPGPVGIDNDPPNRATTSSTSCVIRRRRQPGHRSGRASSWAHGQGRSDGDERQPRIALALSALPVRSIA
jgi:hypothetical protein